MPWELRLWQHQHGLGANHTLRRLPVKLVYHEFYERVDDAFYQEKQVQGWNRAKKKAMVVMSVGSREEYFRQAPQRDLLRVLEPIHWSQNASRSYAL
jgi:putative endonuclease